MDEFEQAFHVAGVAGTVNQGGAQDGVGHAAVFGQVDEGLFGGEFAAAIGGVGAAGGGFG